MTCVKSPRLMSHDPQVRDAKILKSDGIRGLDRLRLYSAGPDSPGLR